MNRARTFAIDYFQEMSQSFFFHNRWFGGAFLALLLFFDPVFFACGVFASLIGFGYSKRHSIPATLRHSGILTINGFFFGIAMASLFFRSEAFWVSLVLGAMAIPLLTKASWEVLQHWKLSPMVIAYIMAVWVVWLCGQGLSLDLRPHAWPIEAMQLQAIHPDWNPIAQIAWATCLSAGRLVFLPDPVFGLALMVLVFAFSPRRGTFFILGTVIATVIARVLSDGSAAWEHGYMSYSGGLVGLGLASFPDRFRTQTILLFCAVSTFLHVATVQLFGGYAMLPLSFPFVLTIWLAQLSRAPRLNLSWAPPVTPMREPVLSYIPSSEPAARPVPTEERRKEAA